MRVIKFRAWNVCPPKMYDLSESDYPLSLVTKGDTDYTKFMQYTGLKDKNGAEIYEGDIVKLKTLNSEKGGWYSGDNANGVVEFNDVWGVRFVCKDFSQRTADIHWITKSKTRKEVNNIVVIGNIYENPELLAETK